MNLYLITQDYQGFNTYDAMVVAAEDRSRAYELSRDYAYNDIDDHEYWNLNNNMAIKFISNSTILPEGVACASFHAG